MTDTCVPVTLYSTLVLSSFPAVACQSPHNFFLSLSVKIETHGFNCLHCLVAPGFVWFYLALCLCCAENVNVHLVLLLCAHHYVRYFNNFNNNLAGQRSAFPSNSSEMLNWEWKSNNIIQEALILSNYWKQTHDSALQIP